MLDALFIFILLLATLGSMIWFLPWASCGRCQRSIVRSPRYLFGWRHATGEPEDGHRAWCRREVQ